MEVLDGGKEQDNTQEAKEMLAKAGIEAACSRQGSMGYVGASINQPLKYSGAEEPYDMGWGDKVTVYRDKGREWRWRRTSPNGEIVGTSHEGFKNFADCQANLYRSFCAVSNLDVVVED